MRRRHFLFSTALGSIGLSSASARTMDAEEVRWEYDGAGTIARLGVLTPDFDPAPESELWAMVPRGISIQAARVSRSGGPGARFVDPPHVDDAVGQLVELAPRVILLGYTSSSYELGAEADGQVHARLVQRANGIPLIFTCQAATNALRLLCIRRISVVHPPWWSEVANEQGRVYWRELGFDVLQCTRMQPLRAITEVAPNEVFEYVRASTPHAAEAVFIGGNGLRAVGAIRTLEARLRMPVLSANQVILWQALRELRRARNVTKYGRIFAEDGAAG